MRRLVIFILCLFIQFPIFSQEPPGINFTQQEMIFIENNPVIRVGVDPEFVPFEFIDENGDYKGIASDYLSLIEIKTGIKFEIIKGLSWPDAYEMAVNGEIDILPAVSKTVEGEKYFNFSKPYYNIKRVIVTRDNNTNVRSFDDLKGKIVAVQENSSHHSMLISRPDINLSLYQRVPDALTALADGRENIFIGNMATTNFLIRSEGITNLKFIAFETPENQSLHIAVRKDLPELVTIVNKAFDSITDNERILINSKWIDLEVAPDYGPIIKNIIQGLTAILLVYAVSFFWIIRLKREIKKRKEIQIDLEKAKLEAEEANNIKSSFLARMSHEIRTPLNAITGMSYLLKKTGVTLTQRMYIDRISQASNTMLSIINDILDFSKIEAGKVQLERVSFSLDQVIREVVNIVSYKIEEQRIGFLLSKDPKIPNWFFGDPKRLEQILINLIGNASKFTSKGEVSLELKLIAKEGNDYHIAFFIKDTGIGMNKEQVKKLFEPFAQGDVSINRKYGGTGLGLSIVKNLLEMMGGEIEVFSTEGEGSTFIVNLTLEKDVEKEEEYQTKISSAYFKNIKTLVLEKTGANMNIIDSYLSSFGMKCELTTSEKSAIAMLEESNNTFAKPYDLFIMDYETPEEQGFEFIKKLKNNKKIAKFPKVIFLLPMMGEALFDRLEENGIDGGISKPIIPSVLYNSIIEIFREKVIKAGAEYELPQPKPIKHKALVVEDNKTNQLIAKSLLETAGFEVLIANDGLEGVNIFTENADVIDVVLMDLHMPVMNGYESSEKIRRISKEVPIIAMTADVVQGVQDKFEASGINYSITKPFDPEYFMTTVKTITEEKKQNNSQIVEEAVTQKLPDAIIDISKGMNFIGNDMNIYLMVLKEYFEENQNTVTKISREFEEKNYSEAAKTVHKIKSSSGTIGATSFYKTAVDFHKALMNLVEKQEEDDSRLKELYSGFKQGLEQVLNEIEKIITENK